MKKTLAAILLSTALAILPLSSQADEAQAKMQIATIATGLVPNLPSGKKVVLKTISPEDSGLPADFLRKLTSDIEAALLVASEFEIELINRQTTEEIWAEAIEFNNADFDALHVASGANIALMLNARATEAGVEIAVTAYSLDSADAGRVIASSGSTVLALDMQQNVGVDVNSLNDQMAQVLAEIEKVGQTGGLISDPNTYAEYYHNARILQQRGEVDLAIENLQEAIQLGDRLGIVFFDPILDIVDLIEAKYGVDSAPKYFEKRLLASLGSRTSEVFNLTLKGNDDIHSTTLSLINGTTDPGLALLWLNKYNLLYSDIGLFADMFASELREVNGEGGSYAIRLAKYKAREIVLSALRQGALAKNFIDDIRGQAFSDSIINGLANSRPPQLNLGFTIFGAVSDVHSGATGEPEFTHLSIFDTVYLRRPIEICISFSDKREECGALEYSTLNEFKSLWRRNLKVQGDLPDWIELLWFTSDVENRGTNPLYLFEWTRGITCVKSITYVDAFGYRVKVKPGSQNLINLMAVSQADGGNISSCFSNIEPEVEILGVEEILSDQQSAQENQTKPASTVDVASADKLGSVDVTRALIEAQDSLDNFSDAHNIQDKIFIQQLLKDKGFYTGPIDGDWGTGTMYAFRDLFVSLQLMKINYSVYRLDDFVATILLVRDFQGEFLVNHDINQMGQVVVSESPSFDCSLASSADEIAICANSNLAILDLQVADAFKNLKEAAGPDLAKEIARNALKERRACEGDVDCIEQVQIWTIEQFESVLAEE